VLVLVNVLAYLLSIRHGGSFFGGPSDNVTVHYGAIPYELTHPGKHCDVVTAQSAEGAVRTVACQGMHGVIGSPPGQPATWETAFTSMFLHGSFLHIFGNMLFLVIFGPNVEDATGRPRYLAFYLLGGLVALGAQVLVSPDSTAPTLGASGAIAAVLLLGFWFIEQLWFGAAGLASPLGGGQGVAYFAHIGGFVFGLALIRAFARRDRSSAKRPPPRPVY